MPNNDDDGDKLTEESAILSKSQNCLAVSLYFSWQLPSRDGGRFENLGEVGGTVY